LAVRWNYHGFDVAQRQEAAMSLYAAIDLHSSNSVLAVMDDEGKALRKTSESEPAIRGRRKSSSLLNDPVERDPAGIEGMRQLRRGRTSSCEREVLRDGHPMSGSTALYYQLANTTDHYDASSRVEQGQNFAQPHG
jgi:hypothetical protein